MNWKSLGSIFGIFMAAQTMPGLTDTFVRRRDYTGQNRSGWLQVAQAEKQAAEAISLAQAKSDLLAKVSHELRTPLTSILGVAEMLDYGVYGPLSREQKDALKLVTECTQHMGQLINDLLEQSRLERGAFHLDESDFVLDDVIQRVRRQMAPSARAKGLRFSVKVDADIPPILHGDPLRLHQVVQNLVDNAIKYTETGQVAVKFSRVDDRHFLIQICDTGIGIPREQLNAIFDPYRQVHPAGYPTHANGNGNGDEKGHGSGFGLGLSIVKQLVALMDGDIRVTSTVGEGSIFSVKFPIRDKRSE